MVTLESRSDWDGSVVHSNAFDCLQNTLKTKQSRDLKDSFEAENEILSFHFQEANAELLRNFQKIKASTNISMQEILRRPEGGSERREIPKNHQQQKTPCCSDPDRSQYGKLPSLTSKTSTTQIKHQLCLATPNICQLFDTKVYLWRPSSNH